MPPNFPSQMYLFDVSIDSKRITLDIIHVLKSQVMRKINCYEMHKNFYAKLYSDHLTILYFRPTKLSAFIATKANKIKNTILKQNLRILEITKE